MSQNSLLPALLMNLLSQTPVLLAFLVGALLAILKWRNHPNVSLLVLIACGLGLAVSLIFPALNIWVVQSMSGPRGAERQWIFTGMAIVSSLLRLVIYALLFAAAFSGRAPKQAVGANQA